MVATTNVDDLCHLLTSVSKQEQRIYCLVTLIQIDERSGRSIRVHVRLGLYQTQF